MKAQAIGAPSQQILSGQSQDTTNFLTSLTQAYASGGIAALKELVKTETQSNNIGAVLETLRGAQNAVQVSLAAAGSSITIESGATLTPTIIGQLIIDMTPKQISGEALFNLPHCHIHFQERHMLNKKIHEAFSVGNIAAISHKKTRISGAGGVGKTQLALHYAWQSKPRCYQLFRFISASSETELEQQYRLFAHALGVPNVDSFKIDALRQQVVNRLVEGMGARNALIIFDNADNPEILQPYLDSLQGLCNLHLLMTSRDSRYWSGCSVPVDVYEKSEAVSYVCRALLVKAQQTETDYLLSLLGEDLATYLRTQAQVINAATFDWQAVLSDRRFVGILDFVNKLDCYPLALTHALAYCVKRKTSLTDYVQKFDALLPKVIIAQKNKQADTLKPGHRFDEEMLDGKYQRSIYVAFRLSFDAMAQLAGSAEAGNINYRAVLQTLGLLAQLNADAIPEDLLNAVIGSALQHCNEEDSDESEAEATANIIEVLQGYSFLQDNKKDQQGTSMHRLIQTVIRYHWRLKHDASKAAATPSLYQAPEVGLQDLMKTLRAHCNTASEGNEYDLQATLRRDYQPHMQSVLEHGAKLKLLPSADSLALQSLLGVLALKRGDESKAVTIQEGVLALPEVNHPDMATLKTAIRLRLARSLMAKHQFLDAKAILKPKNNDKPRSCLAANPLSLAWQETYADLLCQLHNPDKARATIDALLSTNSEGNAPCRQRLQYAMARLQFDIKQYTKAKALIDAVTANPAITHPGLLAKAYLLLAKIHEQGKDEAGLVTAGDKAVQYAEEAHRDSPIHMAEILIDYAYTLKDTLQRGKRAAIAKRGQVLLESLAKAGIAKAHYRLGWAYDKGVFVEYSVKHSKQKAFKYYTDAASLGYIDAQRELGNIYLDGKGAVAKIPRHARLNKAYALFKQAASVDFNAQFALADMIMTRQGPANEMKLDERIELAFPYYLTSAKSGLAQAEFALGRCFLNKTVPSNYQEDHLVQGKKWLTRAAKQKLDNSQGLLTLTEIVTVFSSNGELSEEMKQKLENEHPKSPWIYFASSEGYIEGVEMLVKIGKNLNVRHWGTGQRPVHMAALNGHTQLFAKLYDMKADVTSLDDNCSSVLHMAAADGHVDIIELALQYGVPIDSRDIIGGTPIFVAAGKGQLRAFEFLKENNADMNAVDNKGLSLTHLAALGGHPDILRDLLGHESRAHSVAYDGGTPIFSAVMMGYLSAYTLLREKGACLHLIDLKGWGLLHAAAQGGNSEILHDILRALSSDNARFINHKTNDGRTPIYQAALSGQLDAFRILKENDADMNAVDNRGWSLLHAAVQGGHPDIIREVISAGVSVESKAKDKSTPIFVAAASGQMIAFELLRQKNANILEKNKAGQMTLIKDDVGLTVLHAAAQGGSHDILDAILSLESGVDINALDKHGQSPIYTAALCGKLTAFNVLKHKQADIGLKNKTGCSLLHAAANGGDVKIIKILLNDRFDINLERDTGVTPIHQAALMGKTDAFYTLKEAGADLRFVTKSKNNIMHSAMNGGKIDIIKMVPEPENLMNAPNKMGLLPLHLAAGMQHLTAIKWLMSKGAKLAVSNNGWTMLHVAAAGGHPGIIQFLLDSGVNVNAGTASGVSALHIAAREGHIATFMLLVKNGARIKAVDKAGRNCLHYVIIGGEPPTAKGKSLREKFLFTHNEVVGSELLFTQMLLESGQFDKKIKIDRLSLFDYAYKKQNWPLASLLRHHGIKSREYSDKALSSKLPPVVIPQTKALSESIRHHAQIHSNAHKETSHKYRNISLLKKYKVKRPSKAKYERVFRKAAAKNRIKDFLRLLSFGVDVNAQDNYIGKTALHHAVAKRHLQIVSALLRAGARDDIQDKNGVTAKELADMSDKVELIALFNHSAPFPADEHTLTQLEGRPKFV